jgi:hypothetical protein
MDAVEVIETGRKLSETTLGEWGMVFAGFLAAVPFIATLLILWLRARAKRDKYKCLLDDSNTDAFPRS